jgi:glucokinase
MSPGFPRLLGDIGGTNARWAWQASAGLAPQDVVVLQGAANASLMDSAADYMARTGHRAPRWAAIGVATPVTGDQVRLTNGAWSFSIAALKRSLGVERCLVINDFTALAMSLPGLQPTDLRAVGAGLAVPHSPLALLGPGTGLGVSGLLPDRAGGWSALSGEGGHVTLAAADDKEAALLAVLRRRFGHVSAERVLSGSGLVNLVQALAELRGQPSLAGSLQPADVAQHAIAGTDALCAQAVQVFSSLLGNVAGNLVLTLGARGGVYLGGGIVPRLGAAFDAAVFRRRFEGKGRFAAYLQAVPSWVITAATPALAGAARALDLLSEPAHG